MRLPLFLIVLLLGCSTPVLRSPSWHVTSESDVDPSVINVFLAACVEWGDASEGLVECVYDGVAEYRPAERRIGLVTMAGEGAQFGRYGETTGTIAVGRHVNRALLAHEMGHALGLGHCDAEPSIMNSAVFEDSAVTPRDVHELERRLTGFER